MDPGRISRIRIQGFRSIDDLSIDVGGLLVLIGDNGSGKSTLIEALDIIASAASMTSYADDIVTLHGTPRELLRSGATELRFSIWAEGEASVHYEFSLVPRPDRLTFLVRDELLTVGTYRVIERSGARTVASVLHPGGKQEDHEIAGDRLALTWFGRGSPETYGRITQLLTRMRVHVPLALMPRWVTREPARFSPLRVPVPPDPTGRLERLGVNLANCFHELRNRGGAQWQRVLEDVRAGIGLDVLDVLTPVPTRGFIELALSIRNMSEPVPAAGISDGQLTYLAFVALAHLNGDTSLLAFDEPELHLHPGLVTRMTWLLERIAKHHPVIVSTHSDTLLDALSDPVASVRVCRLSPNRSTVALSLSGEELERWRETYSSIGRLRREGLLHTVLSEAQKP